MKRLYRVTCALGTEELVEKELKSLGVLPEKAETGSLLFEGTQEDLYRVNYLMRTGMRVFVPLRDFAAQGAQMLYDQVRRVRWEDLLDANMTFRVDARISKNEKNPNFNNSQFVALKVKDAIVDRLRQEQGGTRPNVSKDRPDVIVDAYLNRGRCYLALDSTGESLSYRGYRTELTEAPLRETLAAALLDLTEWDGTTTLIDGMCGSGTFVLEAARKALKVPTGQYRKEYGFMRWKDFDPELWNKVKAIAQKKREHKLKAKIYAIDQNPQAIAAAKLNARQTQVLEYIQFIEGDFSKMEDLATQGPGIIFMNPPYGDRMGEDQHLEPLYERMGDILKQKMQGWKAYIFTGNLELAKKISLRASKKHRIFNGPIECRLLEYEMYKGSKETKEKKSKE